jgi:hypothetical protein
MSYFCYFQKAAQRKELPCRWKFVQSGHTAVKRKKSRGLLSKSSGKGGGNVAVFSVKGKFPILLFELREPTIGIRHFAVRYYTYIPIGIKFTTEVAIQHKFSECATVRRYICCCFCRPTFPDSTILF